MSSGILASRGRQAARTSHTYHPRELLKRGFLITLLTTLAAAGCGGSSTHTTETNTSQGAVTSTASTTPTVSGHLSDCNAVGINPAEMHEGTCTHGGVTWVIVDENHTLKLKTLWGTLAGVRRVKVLATSTGTTSANGEFVVASVTLTNKLPASQRFDAAGSQQAALNLGGAVFKEAVNAESKADARSCLSLQGAQIQPQKSEVCDVIFDVPASAAAALGKHGSGDLYLTDFGTSLSGSVLPQTIGQIRLYR